MRKTLVLLFLAIAIVCNAQPTWPSSSLESKAGLRWWWPGSAVDENNIKWLMKQYADAGVGSVEITPIYGVQGNQANAIDFLTPKWMHQLSVVESEGAKDGILVDMNTGTGWPFGGPTTPIEEAACKVLFVVDTVVIDKVGEQPILVDIGIKDPKEKKFATLKNVIAYPIDVQSFKGHSLDLMGHVEGDNLNMLRLKGTWLVIAQYESRTRQQVKRAAPGGAGYVIDHFDKNAVKHYLERFDRAFSESGVAYPHNFFNDSYEVYNANWTPSLLEI